MAQADTVGSKPCIVTPRNSLASLPPPPALHTGTRAPRAPRDGIPRPCDLVCLHAIIVATLSPRARRREEPQPLWAANRMPGVRAERPAAAPPAQPGLGPAPATGRRANGRDRCEPHNPQLRLSSPGDRIQDNFLRRNGRLTAGFPPGSARHLCPKTFPEMGRGSTHVQAARDEPGHPGSEGMHNRAARPGATGQWRVGGWDAP